MQLLLWWVPWVPEVFFLACDGELRFVGHRPTRVRPKAEVTRGEVFRAGHFLRLDRNRKPRMKSLWHPGYVVGGGKQML